MGSTVQLRSGEERARRSIWLRCRHCEDILSPSNVSRAYDSHQSACRALKRQKVQQAFFPKAAQTEKAIEALAMFFYTTETPFHKVGSEFLQQAFMLLGCKIPARRELAGKYLEAAYQLVKARVDKELHVAVGATALLMALATDGWRKRAAALGAPLVNAMLLMPNIQMLNVKRIKRCIPCIHTVYILLYV